MQKVYTKIESIVGNVVTVRASGVRNGDLALVGDSYANVIKLDRDLVTLQVFSGTQGVSTTDPVRFLGLKFRGAEHGVVPVQELLPDLVEKGADLFFVAECEIPGQHVVEDVELVELPLRGAGCVYFVKGVLLEIHRV